MNTEIKNAIQAADSEAQYDESAKRLLAQKYVLAHILVRTVEEFQGMEIEKVASLIRSGCHPAFSGKRTRSAFHVPE